MIPPRRFQLRFLSILLLTQFANLWAQSPPDSLITASADTMRQEDLMRGKDIETPETYVSAEGDTMEIMGFTMPIETSEVFVKPVFQANLLQGEWQWLGAHYKAFLQMDNERFYLQRFFEDSDSKIGEQYLSYKFMQDSIVLDGMAGDSTHLCFWIRHLSPDSMILQNAANFELVRYRRIGMDFPPMPTRQQEFALINKVLTCAADITTPSIDYAPCLKIGNLDLNWSLDSVISTFGAPTRTVVSKQDSALHKYVFALQSFQGTQPELIVTYHHENQTLMEIQVRGFGTVENLEFASIRLGDYISFVEQRLGKPTEHQWDPESLTTKWKYSPYPIVFEFKNKYLNGIKILRKGE